MNDREAALVLAVIHGLRFHGSRAGKPHIQKSLFLLRSTSSIDVPFEYVLFKRGPYSIGLESELEQMQTNGVLTVEYHPQGFGEVLSSGPRVDLEDLEARLDAAETAQVDRLCRFIGSRSVVEVERIATAVWIRVKEGIADPELLASRLSELHPHVTRREAQVAGSEALAFLKESGSQIAPDADQ